MKYYIAIFLPYCNAVFILSISNYYLITFIILIELNIKEVQPIFFNISILDINQKDSLN